MKICGACIMNIFNCPSNVDIIIRIYPITQTVNIINMVTELQWTVFPHSRGKRELGPRENSRGNFNEGNVGKS